MNEAKLKAITGLLTSFPQSASDREGFLKVMLAVVNDVSEAAVRDTAMRFAKGEVPNQELRFAPTPAEFRKVCLQYDAEANHKAWLRNRETTPAVSYAKTRSPYMERLQAKKDMYAAFPILHEGVTHDGYMKLVKRKQLPNPHFYVAHTGIVYSGLHPKLAGNPSPRPFHEVAE